ncbi:eukaryotic translation initiation factor 3 subunit K-like [Anneissia japonica]|uniref:eukaryotic translation initiation factor 3 subunit K-like n=1 Tax=Anneissia japonica TaxID=1529436 RepID=UPI001425758E|nr:eukaryotic translation initiation factor 3 subunit K-like [Anneissia japonica]
MSSADDARATVSSLLKGIDRYNPENLAKLERYVEIQTRENSYDLEANLAVLKLYQLNPMHFQLHVSQQILLKALTNLPHTDFILCKCLIDESHQQEPQLKSILYLHLLLETCEFQKFWNELVDLEDIVVGIVGFEDSIRKFICHVLKITYQTISKRLLAQLLGDLTDRELEQWMTKYGWRLQDDGKVFITNQDEIVKTKNITEKIDFESVASIMAHTP